MEWTDTNAGQDKNHLSFGILYALLFVILEILLEPCRLNCDDWGNPHHEAEALPAYIRCTTLQLSLKDW